MTTEIEIRDLTKRFGDFTAVDGVSFRVSQGEVLGFLGPNGAGKSTTMKMVTGFLTPTSGDVSICGHAMDRAPIAAKRQVGYLPEGAPAYADMTPAQILDFVAAVRGLDGEERRRAIGRAVERVNLHGVIDKRIETLSKGFKRRVGLAVAILHDPPVLIMDEPTDGLDPNQKHEVRALIREMASDKAIILSTHILEEVEAVCTRAIVIASGKLRFDGTPDELEARSRHYGAVTLALRDADADAAAASLGALDGVGEVERVATDDGRLVLRAYPANGAEILSRVGDAARAAGWSIDELRSERGRLDDVFRDITTPTGAAS